MTGIEKPIAKGTYLLQKFLGKGGWTYAEIPTVLQNKKNPFGWIQVKGSIDSFQFAQYKLMPMGNNRLFLPVKALIRKRIQKSAGDTVKIVLFTDESALQIPADIMACFKFEPKVTYVRFLSLKTGEQKRLLAWIAEAKTDETKSRRILHMMEALHSGSAGKKE